MVWSDLWALELLLVAFAGGAFEAALRALPAFVFTGFVVVAGESIQTLTNALVRVGVVGADQVGTVAITGAIGFGPVFGPHVSFAAGTAAAAYASKRGYMDTGFDYAEAIFYAHADTHFDPPAAAIVVNTAVIAVLALAGVFPTAVWIPTL